LVILNDFQMAGFTGVTATNTRSAAASRALVADGRRKNAVAFASVSGTAAVVTLRLHSSRLSAPLHFSTPEPLTEACQCSMQLHKMSE